MKKDDEMRIRDTFLNKNVKVNKIYRIGKRNTETELN